MISPMDCRTAVSFTAATRVNNLPVCLWQLVPPLPLPNRSSHLPTHAFGSIFDGFRQALRSFEYSLPGLLGETNPVRKIGNLRKVRGERLVDSPIFCTELCHVRGVDLVLNVLR